MAIENKEEAQTENNGAPQGQETDQEMVDVHDASVQDLDAALASAQAAEVADEGSNADATAATETQGAVPQHNAGDAEQQTAANAGANPAATPSKPLTQDEIQGIIAENARLKQEGNQKELFIQRRSTELGQLRQQLSVAKGQLTEMRKQLTTGLEEKFQENPAQAVEDRDRIREIDSQIADLDSQDAKATRMVEAMTLFTRHVNTDEVSPDDIVEMLKADGVTEAGLQAFKANPWDWAPAEALIQMGKRAHERKQFVSADNDRRILAKHVLKQNAELEKLRQRPKQIVTQLQQNLNRNPDVTAASSVTAKTARDLDPTTMSIAELDAALKHATLN